MVAKKVAGEPLREALWARPDDVEALKVWADHLVDVGDPRGEFIQLSLLANPTAGQVRRRDALMRKTGDLVGPARPFLRYWGFGSNGLIREAVCEASKLVDGFEHIAALSPRLVLDITSLRTKTKQTLAALAQLPLARIHFVRLDANGLNDHALLALAPALKGVRHLSLAGNDITADGLRRFGAYAESLEFLCLGSATRAARRDAVANAWADALCETPGYRALRAVMCFRSGAPDAARLKRLRALPNMRSVSVLDYSPYDDDVEDLMTAYGTGTLTATASPRSRDASA